MPRLNPVIVHAVGNATEYYRHLSALHDVSLIPRNIDQLFFTHTSRERHLAIAPVALQHSLRQIAHDCLSNIGWDAVPVVMEAGQYIATQVGYLALRPNNTFPNPLRTLEQTETIASARNQLDLGILMDGVTLDPIYRSLRQPADVSA
jgi:hypothetical protein